MVAMMSKTMAKSKDDETTGFGFLLNDVARLMRRQFDRRARDIDMTRAQSAVLCRLRKNEGINQVTLADILDIEPITLARLVDKLEKAGWVERRPDAKDRRMHRLYLLPAAQSIFEKIRPIGQATRKEAFASIAVEDQRQFMETLQKIKSNLTAKAELAVDDE